MKSTYRAAAFAACSLLAVGAQGAEPVAPVAAAPIQAIPAPGVLRLGTAVRLVTEEALSSKTTKTGQRFHLAVIEDVKLGDIVVIPAGAHAIGEVTNVTKKGAFGKSGKLDTRVLYVIINDRNVPLTGTSHEAGKGGTGATVAVAIAVGVFSAFVTGHSAEYPVGTEMTAFTESDLPVTASMAAPTPPLVVPVAAPAQAPAVAAPPVLTPVSATVPATATPK